MAQRDVYGKLLKEWGGFQIGDIVRFGRSKFDNLAGMGIVEKVKKQPAMNDVEEPKPIPKVETTMAELKVEKAVVTPQPVSKESVKPAEDKPKDK